MLCIKCGKRQMSGRCAMSDAVLISIKPEWCEKIAGGEKTIEVRKTVPKLKPPFKCYKPDDFCSYGERKDGEG